MKINLANKWETIKSMDGKSFNDVVRLDGIPLWWFFKRMFIYNVTPRFIIPLKKLEKVNSISNIYISILSKLTRKFIIYNEKKKIKKISLGIIDKDVLKNILFLSYTNHIKEENNKLKVFRLDNLINKIKKDKKIGVKIAIASPLSEKANQLNIYNGMIYKYVDRSLINYSKKKAKILLSSSKKFINENKNIFNGELRILNNNIYFFLSYEMIFLVVLYYEALKRMIEMENIKVVGVTADSVFFERCALAAAHNLNIPSIMIQHGLGIGFTELEGQFLRKNKFLVFGKEFENILLKKGYNKGQIEVVGPMVFDDIIKYKKIKQKNNKICLMTSVLWEDKLMGKEKYIETMENLFKILDQTGYEVVIKPHPRERNNENYMKIIKNSQLKSISLNKKTDKDELYKEIRESEFVITFSSNVAFESMILDRRVILIDLINNKYKIPINFEDIRIIKNINELKKAIERIKTKKNKISFNEQLNNLSYKNDGKSYIRVLKVIYSLLNKNIY